MFQITFEKERGNTRPCNFVSVELSPAMKIDWVGWRRGDRWVVEPWICAGRDRMVSTEQRAGEAGENKQQFWRINSACLSEDCQSLPDDGQSGCSQSICHQVGEQRVSEPWRGRTQTIWRGSAGQYLSAVAMLDQHKRQGHFGTTVRTCVHVSPYECKHQSRLKS